MSGRSYLDAEPWQGRFSSAPRLKALSVEDVLAFRPCSGYPEAKVRSLASKFPARATLLEVVPALVSEGVPCVDILWLAHHREWFEAPDVVLRWLACDYAGMALPPFEARRGDARPRQAIEVARRYAMGLATIDQLREARYAAYAAAAAAAADADAAAYAAAYAAAAAAAAAYAAAAAAAYADADAAAYADADADARGRQVDRLLFVLRGGQ